MTEKCDHSNKFKAGHIFNDVTKWKTLLQDNNLHMPWLRRIFDQGYVSMTDPKFCDEDLFNETLDFDGQAYANWPALAQQPLQNYKSFTNNHDIGMQLIESQLECGAIQ